MPSNIDSPTKFSSEAQLKAAKGCGHVTGALLLFHGSLNAFRHLSIIQMSGIVCTIPEVGLYIASLVQIAPQLMWSER